MTSPQGGWDLERILPLIILCVDKLMENVKLRQEKVSRVS